MKSFTQILVGAIVAASPAFAQGARSLVDTIRATPDLSALGAALAAYPDLLETLGGASNITVLAPNNAAFEKLTSSPGGASALSNQARVRAILQYHVLGSRIPSSAIKSDPAFVPTLLTDSAYTNVTGGQVVQAYRNSNNEVIIGSGLTQTSKVVTPDVEFTGGVAHVIDTVLTVPASVSDTANAAGLSSLVGALGATNLVDTVNNLANATVFAPNNDAFTAAANATASASPEQISRVLTYHVVAGTVGYSTKLRDGQTIATVNGAFVTISIKDGKVSVNDAQVVTKDVLTANGVVHVVDKVLNPANATATASASGTSPTSTSTATAESKAVANSVQGAFGLVALLGAGAVFLNLA